MAVELDLHDNRPNIDADIKGYDGIETDLSAAALFKAFRVEDESETKAANTKDVLLVCKEGLKGC